MKKRFYEFLMILLGLCFLSGRSNENISEEQEATFDSSSFDETSDSKYRIGKFHQEKGNWEEAFRYYLEAYQSNPQFAEPLYQIGKYYLSINEHNLAYLFAKHGSLISKPNEKGESIEHAVYDYLLDELISLSAYYTPYREEGYAATNRLMLKKNIPFYIKEQAYKNIQFYLQPLKNAHYQPVEINLPLIREGQRSRYNPLNPSIQKTEEGYKLICRTVNYIQINARHFQVLDWTDSSKVTKNRNFFIQYDRDFHLISQQEIIEELPRERKKFLNIEGIEDCRMFDFKGSTWFTCTTIDTSPCGKPQISLCKLADNKWDSHIHVENLIPLLGPDPTRCEKNWLPFIKDGAFHVIYSFDPYIIYRPEINEKNNTMQRQVTVHYQVPEQDYSNFSGSAPPIEFDAGYLVIVHETVYEDSRRDMHRFVYLDHEFNIQKVSKPFFFLHNGIEYCCGMTIDHSETNLVISIGVEDREAFLCFVDLNTVRDILMD